MSRLITTAERGAIAQAAALLRAGELVAIPTETVYGLVALPTQEGTERLIAAKQRSSDKGIQLLIDSLDQARALAILTPAAELLAERYWPGGLTLVLARRPDVELPELLGGGRPTLGLRLPDHPVPRELARQLGPLAASSANVSGQPAAGTAEQAMAYLGDVVGLVVDDGPVRGGISSSVVSCLPGERPVVLREGAISAADIGSATATLDEA